ncbi:hypothetical protein D9758_012798 [Tetrapyrgos nigripes]|uniref:ABM domain-containing protein n=1 Tax=Tetrapyrgos nigripes TaxID=182062 RepID=A0A8H5D069_9AGAR|nr:hypothetical protein D9758_012798 [Tetrapyrgos nigripes]
MMSDNAPEQTKTGKLVIVATLKIKPGKESRFEELVSKMREEANSDKEPGTLSYRTNRVLDKEGKPTGAYIVFEEYKGKDGLTAHMAKPATQAFLAEGEIIAGAEVAYAEEF